MATYAAGNQGKTWKKTTTVGAATTPVGHRNTEPLQSEGQHVQIPQTALSTMEDLIRKMQQSFDRKYEIMTDNLVEMRSDFKKMDDKIEDKMVRLDQRMEAMQGALEGNKEELKVMKQQFEEEVEKIDKRTTETETKMEVMAKEMEETFINYEMEKSAFYLRFQNVVETENEDLPRVMTDIISGVTKMTAQDIIPQFDEIYRINTNYARRHKFPREVHIRFGRRSVKEDVYLAAKETTAIYKGKEVKILRQTPRRVREKRRPYQFLSSKLNRYRIPFRWLIPEGLHVTWQEKKFKIINIDEAKDFFDRYIKAIEEKEGIGDEGKSRESMDEASTEDLNLNLEKEERRGKGTNDHDRDRPNTRAQTGARKEKMAEST